MQYKQTSKYSLFSLKNAIILLNPFLISVHVTPISRSLVHLELQAPIFQITSYWHSPSLSHVRILAAPLSCHWKMPKPLQLTFIKCLLWAKLWTLCWAKEDLISLPSESGSGPILHTRPNLALHWSENLWSTRKRPRQALAGQGH